MIPLSTPNAQTFTTMCPPSKTKERMYSVIVPNQTTRNPIRPPQSPSNKDSTLTLPTTTNDTHKVNTILPPSTCDVQTTTTMCPSRTSEERQQYDDDGASMFKVNDDEVEVLFEEGVL